MATCLQSINSIISSGQIGVVQVLHPATISTFNIGPGGKKLFYFEMVKKEIIKFIFDLVSVGAVGPIEMTMTMFKYDPITHIATEIGGALLTILNQELQKDINSGSYFMCITNKYSTFNTSVTSMFTGFSQQINFTPRFYSGSSVKAETYKEHPCTAPVFFSIIAGSLPPGLTLSKDGCIIGRLPNMDCLDENADLSPSADWYGQLPTGEWYPWGRQWRFRVKIWLADFPAVVNDSWFCVRIYNDWDREKNNLKSQLPLNDIIRYHEEVVVKDVTIPQLCPECVTEKKPKPMTIQCVPCEENVQTNKQVIELPKSLCELAPDELLSWWQANRSSTNPEIQSFLNDLMNSKVFKILLIKKGLIEGDKTEQVLAKSKIVIEKTNSILELKLSKLKDGRNIDDVDYEMLQDIKQLNQSLDMDCIMFGGTSFYEFNLT